MQSLKVDIDITLKNLDHILSNEIRLIKDFYGSICEDPSLKYYELKQKEDLSSHLSKNFSAKSAYGFSKLLFKQNLKEQELDLIYNIIYNVLN